MRKQAHFRGLIGIFLQELDAILAPLYKVDTFILFVIYESLLYVSFNSSLCLFILLIGNMRWG